MRADRLLSILLLLQVHQRMTAHELAKRLEVSERTIHRDMEALSAAGIPVIAERGSGGGWGLLDNYRTNLTGLTEAEIQSLFLTKPARLLADLGLHRASEAALIKLLAALPSISRRDAEYVRQRIHVDATSWHPTEEDVSSLPTLQEAIWRERRLHFIYQRGAGDHKAAPSTGRPPREEGAGSGRGQASPLHVERVVDPLGLVAKGSTWYLVAAIEGEIRSYRVSRILSARVTDEPFVRPEDFDLAGHWAQSSTHFVAHLPQYPVTVRITQDALERIYHAGRYARIASAEPADAEGWIKLHLLFEMEEAACGYLLSFGTQVEILEPWGLREKIISLAEDMLAFYAQKSSATG